MDVDSIVDIISIALTGYKESENIKKATKEAFMKYYNIKDEKTLDELRNKHKNDLKKRKKNK